MRSPLVNNLCVFTGEGRFRMVDATGEAESGERGENIDPSDVHVHSSG